MARILIVEDEAKIARFIELELVHEGYEVAKASDGREGVDAALAGDFDLILLDVMLPQLNGLEVLRRIRREKSTPVIMLTARDSVMDKVAGLDAGADDYITKPFAIEELLARVRVALKHLQERAPEQQPGQPSAQLGQASGRPELIERNVAAATTTGVPSMTGPSTSAPSVITSSSVAAPRRVLSAGPVTLDVDRHAVEVGGERVELTGREFEVLRVLLENKEIVLTRDRIAQLACGFDYVGETNIIDVYVRHIRAKIDDRFGIRLVTTVRGVGYVVREP